MIEFSCRNCVQNPMQGTSMGKGQGYCLQWSSVLDRPDRTTCKYLHRKDLPRSLVDESTAEHAREFASSSGPVDLHTQAPCDRKRYSERHYWDTRTFDATLHAVAMYHKGEDAETTTGKWRYIQAFGGSSDARRALGYASLFRRYMQHCNSWTSSYRLVLAQIEEIAAPVLLPAGELLDGNGLGDRAAAWELLFAQLSGVQEFGWHAALDSLRTPMTSLGEAVADLDWEGVCRAVSAIRADWRAEVIALAQAEGIYFAPQVAAES